MQTRANLIVAIVAACLLLAGCRDYQAEARIAADSAVSVARIQADASVQRTRLSEDGATERNAVAWQTAPIALSLIGLIGCAWLVLWFRGRAHLVRVQLLASPPPIPQLLPASPPTAVLAEAQRRGLLPVEEDGAWLLLDVAGVPRLRMLPPPK